mmetsp:Transcript_49/g.8  ORF Transcript_49/g.8 Transcript_49/m.8 type:complete len:86 (+) Transcript_49:1381-1638(+)
MYQRQPVKCTHIIKYSINCIKFITAFMSSLALVKRIILASLKIRINLSISVKDITSIKVFVSLYKTQKLSKGTDAIKSTQNDPLR